MSVEAVQNYLERFGVQNRILRFDVSSATVDLAAFALRCEACRIAKTLSFDCDEKTILIVVAGDCKIDNAKYKKQFYCKAKMLQANEVCERTGHVVGGVCPFANPDDVKIYLDVSLKRFQTVFPACGSANSAIEVTPEELERYVPNAIWVDVCKPKENR